MYCTYLYTWFDIFEGCLDLHIRTTVHKQICKIFQVSSNNLTNSWHAASLDFSFLLQPVGNPALPYKKCGGHGEQSGWYVKHLPFTTVAYFHLPYNAVSCCFPGLGHIKLNFEVNIEKKKRFQDWTVLQLPFANNISFPIWPIVSYETQTYLFMIIFSLI